jgi:hypothetical protein
MKRRQVLGMALALTAGTPLGAQEALWAENNGPQQRDGAVLEAVMVDVLTCPDSPVERGRGKKIYLSMEAYSGTRDRNNVLKLQDAGKLEQLTPGERQLVQEAADDLLRRSKREPFKPFTPKDKRVVAYRKEQREADDARRKKEFFVRPQVFLADTPGYAKDGSLALVRIGFPWSGGFHSGEGTYLLIRQGNGWRVLLRDFIHYV